MGFGKNILLDKVVRLMEEILGYPVPKILFLLHCIRSTGQKGDTKVVLNLIIIARLIIAKHCKAANNISVDRWWHKVWEGRSMSCITHSPWCNKGNVSEEQLSMCRPRFYPHRDGYCRGKKNHCFRHQGENCDRQIVGWHQHWFHSSGPVAVRAEIWLRAPS